MTYLERLKDLEKQVADFLTENGFVKSSTRNWTNSNLKLRVFNCPHPCLKVAVFDVADPENIKTVSILYLPNNKVIDGKAGELVDILQRNRALTNPDDVVQKLQLIIDTNELN